MPGLQMTCTQLFEQFNKPRKALLGFHIESALYGVSHELTPFWEILRIVHASVCMALTGDTAAVRLALHPACK